MLHGCDYQLAQLLKVLAVSTKQTPCWCHQSDMHMPLEKGSVTAEGGNSSMVIADSEKASTTTARLAYRMATFEFLDKGPQKRLIDTIAERSLMFFFSTGDECSTSFQTIKFQLECKSTVRTHAATNLRPVSFTLSFQQIKRPFCLLRRHYSDSR